MAIGGGLGRTDQSPTTYPRLADVAEIGLTGRAPGRYNLYLGGGAHGQRLNKMYLENVGND